MINDLLDLSRLESGRFQLARGRVEPMALAEDVVERMRPRAEAQGLTLEVQRGTCAPAAIQTDPGRLRQIMVNLVDNAIKFTPAGFVRVHIGTDDGHDMAQRVLEIRVIDNGVGIDDKQQRRIFEAFTQADGSSTRRQGGTGMGLAITHRLAELLGGALTLVSAPAQGSVFTVTVAIDGPATSSREVEPESRRAGSPQVALQGDVLVVEDGPDNQRILCAFLRRAGLQVTLAENGQLACEQMQGALADERPFDLVFMDISMPVMDGHEATRQIRRMGYTGSIVALTAHALSDDRERALAAGCDDYMTKPIQREPLIALARQYLTKPIDG